jgi:hypothetical protein
MIFRIRKKKEEAMSAKFDIFKRLSDGQPIWVKAVESLEEARKQLTELSEKTPGEYFIFNAISGQVIPS